MHTSIAETSWTILFRDKALFARLWRGAVLQFMAQMCGATAIKYYLPTIFIALGLSKDLSLLASGIESTLKIGCTIMEMFLVDRIGRRWTLLLGSGIMSVAMLVSSTAFWPHPFRDLREPYILKHLIRSTELYHSPSRTTRTTPQITPA